MSASSRPVRAASVRPRPAAIALAGLGAALALSLVGALAAWTGQPWLLGSFGATCALLFAFPDGPFSQPRNVIGGHCLASLVGLIGVHLLGPGWAALGITAACALMLMLATGTMHPPAGSNPVIVFMAQPGWEFLWLPTLAGACLLMLLGRLYWRCQRRLARRGSG